MQSCTKHVCVRPLGMDVFVHLEDEMDLTSVHFHRSTEVVGWCFRFDSMKSYSVPEILRVPLEELCLHIMVSAPAGFPCVLRKTN